MLADWSNRTFQRQDRKECSALSVVVFLMLVGSVAADTKATKGNAYAEHHNPITP